ncbi:hypothetical protein IV203_026343 [Nitzschia inconspicua]|uniref:Uncharacterized protein n=1 Tax=Nitzschia inconspicua TaxID=303405 RepID=A0A9K3PX50_9STRA|nr:hypothetical protein IV203_026343 [Nitzschia inconspicua]
MAEIASTTAVTAASALCAVIVGGLLVYSNRVEQQLILSSEQKDVEDRLAKLEVLENNVKKREEKVKEESRLLEERRISLKQQEDILRFEREELEKRESAVTEAEAALKTKEQELQRRQEELEKQAAERDDEKTADTEISVDEEDRHDSDAETIPKPKAEPESSSEGEKRKQMIDEELSNLIKEADENELEDPFDEESIEALKKAAHKICYLKKYYDVMKDKFIFFPSVTKSVVDYTLIEEAEKFYYDEDDEYPQDLSIGLRSVATMRMAEEDDDIDEDYMLALAQDVEL